MQRAELGAAELTGLKQQAFGLLASQDARKAFDLSAEPDSVRLAILGTVAGVFATRTVVIATQVRSPRF